MGLLVSQEDSERESGSKGGGGEGAWTCVEAMLWHIMTPPVDYNYNHEDTLMMEGGRGKDQYGNGNDDVMITHHHNCMAWDASLVTSTKLFGEHEHTVSSESGTPRNSNGSSISTSHRHRQTDDDTVFEQVWSIMEGVPGIVSQKSKIIVRLFVGFLNDQYFIFHDDDPDQRELHLEDFFEELEKKEEDVKKG